MRKDVQDLIDKAQKNIEVCERNNLPAWTQTYMIASIAESLQAMVKMFASDYERSFQGENDEP